LTLFDTHCHLDVEAFNGDRGAAFKRAHAAGVTAFLNPAFDLASSQRAAALAGQRPDVWAAVGVHPNDAGELDDAVLASLEALLAQPRVVAVGEIGLDYHWNRHPVDVAKAAFVRQIALARAHGVPVIIHCRDAMADALDVLVAENSGPGAVPVLLHAFSGDADQAREAIRRGYWLGIGGPLTYPRAETLRAIAQDAPLERLVLETDSPYLTPDPWRGRRNEPRHVADVAARLAVIRGIDLAEVAAATTQNAHSLFKIESSSAQANTR